MESTMKSSFLDKKKYRKSKKIDHHLVFTPTEEEPISTRDYGLMRTANQSLTPYPHIDLGVDANLLKARLSMRRQIEIKRMSSLSVDNFGSRNNMKTRKSALTSQSSKFVKVDRKATTPISVKNLLSLGTPHPKKGVALNAKALSKRLIIVNEELKQPDPPSAISLHPSRIPKKKEVRLRDSASMHGDDRVYSSLDGERLSDISKRVTQIEYSISDSLQSVELAQNYLSFAERRKRLEWGEFTIAMYGRKMSNLMMASDPLQHKVVVQGTNLAQKANEEIEKYIQSQGLVKTSNDQLQWNHDFDWGSSASSLDSMQQHSLGDIYRDIKTRKYVRSTIKAHHIDS